MRREMRLTRKLLRMAILAVLVTALFALVAGGAAAQGTTVNVTVTASEFKFEPDTLEVPEGAVVTFNVTNSGQFPHNVTFESPAGEETTLFDTNLAAGESRTGTFTFNQVGDWKMYCPVGNHEDRGMVGAVKVVAAAASAPAAATTNSTPSTGQSTAAQPGTLPTTGGGVSALAALVAAGLGAAGVGLRLRRR